MMNLDDDNLVLIDFGLSGYIGRQMWTGTLLFNPYFKLTKDTKSKTVHDVYALIASIAEIEDGQDLGKRTFIDHKNPYFKNHKYYDTFTLKVPCIPYSYMIEGKIHTISEKTFKYKSVQSEKKYDNLFDLNKEAFSTLILRNIFFNLDVLDLPDLRVSESINGCFTPKCIFMSAIEDSMIGQISEAEIVMNNLKFYLL